jgi:6-phosphogluconolactonase
MSTQGRPRTVIEVADATALAAAAAQRLVARIVDDPARPAICLTGGSSPKQLYVMLAEEPYRSRIPWERVHWFIGDDRFVPPDDPLSNIGQARRLFLDRCAPASNVHPIPTGAPTPQAAAAQYQQTLQSFYGTHQLDPARPLFTLVLMGVGPDGHTASLFPGHAALEETERWVVGVDTAPVPPLVPRVTLTLPALGSCREMLFLVDGREKRNVLGRVWRDKTLPAARAHALGDTIWLVDAAAKPEIPDA